MGDTRPSSSNKKRIARGGGTAGIPLPDLRKKVDRVKYALGIRNDQKFAYAIGRTPGTFADYFRGRGAYEKNAVPPAALSAMAVLLVQALGNTATAETAQNLWRGALAEFEAAFEKASRSDFRALVTAAVQSGKILTFVRHERSLTLRAIDFLDLDIGEDGSADGYSRTGDTFHFECAGPRGHWLVVLIEDQVGVQLGWPREQTVQARFADGAMQVPATERGWKFAEPGLHRFIAFAIDSEEAPSLSQMNKPLARLTAGELDRFAAELKDRKRVRSWTLEIFTVFVMSEEQPE
jgi:hypothetical protein